MGKIAKPRTTKGLATLMAKVALEKKANNILLLDLSKIDTAPTDFFVICSCDSEPQMDAIVNEMERTSKDAGLKRPRTEGLTGKEWALIDFFDVVVHVMHNRARNFYKLEQLWADAAFYSLLEDGKLKKLKQKDVLDSIIGERISHEI